MSNVRLGYQNPASSDSYLAGQEVIDDNGNTVVEEIISLASHGVHAGGPITNNTPGTPVPLVGSSTPCKHVTIQALGPNYLGVGGNTGWVWIGGSGVNAASNIGIYLPPGASYEIDINDVHKVFFDVNVTGDKVTFNYMV